MKQHGSQEHIMLNPDRFEWKDGPMSLPKGARFAILEGDPSKEGPFTLRVMVPANYKIPPHWHPAVEHVTVLKGSIYMGAGEKLDMSKATKISEGGLAVMPIKFIHYAFTTEEATIQLHGIGPWDIIYVNPKDDPRQAK
ncbi:cupin domain-containing protein [Pontibacter aydingkolensis]